MKNLFLMKKQKKNLKKQYASFNPIELKRKINRLQNRLFTLALKKEKYQRKQNKKYEKEKVFG